MLGEPFLKPKLVGERFAGGAVPLEVLADFAALSGLITDVAKWRYMEANPGRSRAPRGFNDGVSLKLVGIEEGSAILKIVAVASAAVAIGGEANPLRDMASYYEEARERVVAAVGAAAGGGKITDYLPPRYLGHFDKIGRNLADDESLVFGESKSHVPARLTKETRRQLVLASQAEGYTEETAVHGRVHDFNQQAKTFEITCLDGSFLIKIPVTQQHYDTIMDASRGFRSKVRVRVTGVGRFDRDGRMLAFADVESVAILDPLDVRARLDELRLLKAGWLDGEGVELDGHGLEWLADAFDRHYPSEMALPYIYPTPDGRVLVEWASGVASPSLEIDLHTKSGEWHVLRRDGFEADGTFDLAEDSGWKGIVSQLAEYGLEEK